MKEPISDDKTPQPMDWRSFMTMLAVTTVVMGVVFLQMYYKQKYPPAPTPAVPTPTYATTAMVPPAAPGTSATGPVASIGWTLAPASTTAPSTAVVSIGSDAKQDPTYAMQLNVDPAGAGINNIVLNSFNRPEDFDLPTGSRRVYVCETADPTIPGTDPLATRWVEIDGSRLDLSSTVWTLESAPTTGPAKPDSLSVIYSTVLFNHNVPGLKITKSFTVYRRDSQQGGKGYEIAIDYGLTNLTTAAINVKSDFNGPTLPPKEGGRGYDRQVLAGYRQKADFDVAFHPVEEFRKDKQSSLDLSKNDKGTMSWFGTCSVYFEALLLPKQDDPAGDFVERADAQAWKLEDAEMSPDDHPLTLDFNTTAIAVAPDRTVHLPMDFFVGPKWRDVVGDPHYVAAPRDYAATLVVKSGPCSICTVDWLITVMVSMLTAFHWVAGGFAGHGDWGIAIILLVGVVRLALHPITKKSQVQMMKMGKMGPELERLKKKHADDKDELNRQMVQFYKTQGATPILGCLPMFLQMPIWIALYSALQTTFELRQSPFLWHFTWIHDLAKPDYLLNFHRHVFPLAFVPFFGLNQWHIDGLNVLPLVMGVVFFVQQKYMTPPNPAMTEEQRKQQQMMQWITPFIFPLMLYNGPSGLNLYIFSSTLFGVIESKVIRRHIKEREEAEKAGRVIIDARPTRQSKRFGQSAAADAVEPGFLAKLFEPVLKWWAEIERKVEEAKRDPDNGRGKR